MPRTYGLTHVAIAVADPERSFRFYERLLGARVLVPRDAADLSGRDVIEFGTPGCHDVVTLRRSEDGATGDTGNLAHFGFRLVVAEDPDAVAAEVERAGGTVIESGRFSSGDPVVFARDPDGYEIELWFEPEADWQRTT